MPITTLAAFYDPGHFLGRDASMPSTTRTDETIARTLLAIKRTGTIMMPEMYAIWAEFGLKPTELLTELQQVEKHARSHPLA